MRTFLKVSVSYSDGPALAAWVKNLSNDLAAGKISDFDLKIGGGAITGSIFLPKPEGLSVDIGDDPVANLVASDVRAIERERIALEKERVLAEGRAMRTESKAARAAGRSSSGDSGPSGE